MTKSKIPRGGKEMTKIRIYVGNLSSTTSEVEVRDLFAKYGKVLSLNLVTDRRTGECRGFGFVEMEDEEAKGAVNLLDGAQLGGRTLRVSSLSGC
jgi:RNA recognition motif-containing protein